MIRFWAAILITGAMGAQTPADSLGRNTPQESVFEFLQACHAHDYGKAAHYLDLRKMPAAQRSKSGRELAQQLEDLLDDTPFDIATLSRDPEGDQSDGLSAEVERLASFQVDSQALELQLERVELKPGFKVWLVSADSIALIPRAHRLVAETSFEKKLPQPLVSFEVLDTPVWRWIALVLAAVVLWVAAGLVSWPLLAAAPAFRGPIRALLAGVGLRTVMEFAPPAALPRLFLERGLALILALTLAWGVAAVVDLVSKRWQSRLDPRAQAVSYSVLPLGKQILQLSLYLLAVLTVLSAWGYSTSTILAGVGVGGLAVALAAQKTIENLFGGIAVIGDRPVLVGDSCRFGDRSGTVMHIGLRSTRIRTSERTVISVPNGQFSSMMLENISGRDKIWFHPKFNLRRNTTSAQLRQVLSAIQKILVDHRQVEAGSLPVYFVGAGAYSLDVEVSVYVPTRDNEEFLILQQDLWLQMLQAIELAGTALAVPVHETVEAGLEHAPPAPG